MDRSTVIAPNVRYETYLSWNVEGAFDVNIVESRGRRTVSKISCKTCRAYSDKIQNDVRIRGQAKYDCLKFAYGTANVVKCSVKRHLTTLVRMSHCRPIAFGRWHITEHITDC